MRAIVVVAGVAGVVGIALWVLAFSRGGWKERYWFYCMWFYRREAPDVALRYAQKLSESEQGIELALSDIGVYDTTCGWSSWVAENTRLRSYTTRRLSELGDPDNPDLNQRLGALFALWSVTADGRYLEDIFLIVREPGGPLVSTARFRLSGAIGDARLTSRVRVPPTRAVAFDIDGFRQVLQERGIRSSRAGP